MRSFISSLVLAIATTLGVADVRIAIPLVQVIAIPVSAITAATPDVKPRPRAFSRPRVTLDDEDRNAAFGLMLLLAIQGNPVRP